MEGQRLPIGGRGAQGQEQTSTFRKAPLAKTSKWSYWLGSLIWRFGSTLFWKSAQSLGWNETPHVAYHQSRESLRESVLTWLRSWHLFLGVALETWNAILRAAQRMVLSLRERFVDTGVAPRLLIFRVDVLLNCEHWEELGNNLSTWVWGWIQDPSPMILLQHLRASMLQTPLNWRLTSLVACLVFVCVCHFCGRGCVCSLGPLP